MRWEFYEFNVSGHFLGSGRYKQYVTKTGMRHEHRALFSHAFFRIQSGVGNHNRYDNRSLL